MNHLVAFILRLVAEAAFDADVWAGRPSRESFDVFTDASDTYAPAYESEAE